MFDVLREFRHARCARWLAPITAVATVALLVGCATGATSDTETQVSRSHTPAPVAASLVLDKLDVDLTALAADQQAIETFLIGNLGGQDLHTRIADVQVLQGCDNIEVTSETATVPAGQVVQLPVTLGPHRDLGPHRYGLTLESNDPARPSRTLSLRFSVTQKDPLKGTTGPNLVVDKYLIDTGDMPYDWPMYERFTLRNTGNQSLVLGERPALRVEEGC